MALAGLICGIVSPTMPRTVYAARISGCSRRSAASIPQVLRRALPLNGAGVCGAALCDLGFPPEVLRGFALLARTAGLVGHLAEEMRRPIARDIHDDVERNTEYLPPPR